MKNISKIFGIMSVSALTLFAVNVNAAENVVTVNDDSQFITCVSGGDATVCKLAGNIDISAAVPVNKPVTIDLDTHTLNFTGSGAYLVTQTDGTVTITNGTVTSDSTGASAIVVLAGTVVRDEQGAHYADATVDLQLKNVQMSIDSEGGYGILVNQTGPVTATITVDKDSSVTSATRMAISNVGTATINVYGTVKATNTGAAIEGNFAAVGTTDINVFDGAKVSSTGGVGILEMSQGKVTINGGEISGTTAVATTKGDVEVKGGTLTGTGAHSGYSASANFKINEDGSALYIEPVAEVSVSVSGGTLESTHSAALSAPATDNKNDNLTLSLSGGEFNTTDYATPFEVEDKDDEKFVTGGEYNKAFDSKYIVGSNAEVKIGDKFYVGAAAEEAIKEAPKGTEVEVLQGDLTLENVHNGVIVKNSGTGNVSLNGDTIATGKEINEEEQRKIVELQNQVGELTENVTDLTQKLEDVTNKNTELEENLNKTEKALEDAKKSVENLTVESAESKKAIEDLTKMIENLQKQLEDLTKKYDELLASTNTDNNNNNQTENKPTTTEKPSKGDKDNTPKTSTTDYTGLSSIMTLLSTLSLVVLRKRF